MQIKNITNSSEWLDHISLFEQVRKSGGRPVGKEEITKMKLKTD
jgi:hypothetical protein